VLRTEGEGILLSNNYPAFQAVVDIPLPAAKVPPHGKQTGIRMRNRIKGARLLFLIDVARAVFCCQEKQAARRENLKLAEVKPK
jgi:hypothetical protein